MCMGIQTVGLLAGVGGGGGGPGRALSTGAGGPAVPGTGRGDPRTREGREAWFSWWQLPLGGINHWRGKAEDGTKGLGPLRAGLRAQKGGGGWADLGVRLLLEIWAQSG